MGRFIIPTILIGIALAIFFLFTDSIYKEIKILRVETQSYNEALFNSKELQSRRDVLLEQYNNFSADNLQKIEKLLPDNIDNIRLIIEIQGIASQYGMGLQNVNYSTTVDETQKNQQNKFIETSDASFETLNKDYGLFDLEFSTVGSYDNFLNFLADLDKNLRIVDILSVSFSSTELGLLGVQGDLYKYNFKIRTYWLKD